MDKMHKKTDKVLKGLERRIRTEYSIAYDEIEEELEVYLRVHGEEYGEAQEKYQAGEITKDEFLKISLAIFSGVLWNALKDRITGKLVKTDKLTLELINSTALGVFTDNINYGMFAIETGFGLRTDYKMYNKKTAESLYKKAGLKKKVNESKDERWNKKNVSSVLLQGVTQGESIPKIARHLQEVTDMDYNAAIRNARTMMTGAQNAGRLQGYREAEGRGLICKKKWMATLSNRTRDSHRLVDMETVDIEESFSNGCMYPGDPNAEPEEYYNCFVGDTHVAVNCDIIRTYKHRYKGELITIKTSGGVEFTCTPNHPILTFRGWVAANSLNNGDDIIVTKIGNFKMSGGNPYINHIFPSFNALHKFFNMFGSKRTRNLGVNFHGDIPTSDVEIITKKRFLRGNFNTSRRNRVYKFLFKFSNTPFACECSFIKHFRSIWFASFSFICSFCEIFSFFKSSLRHSKIHSLRPIALFDSGRVKPLNYDVPGTIKHISELLNGFTGIVFSDNIISVNRSVSDCHVYNLQSENGYYFVNSNITQNREKVNGIVAISHNCRCTMVAQTDHTTEYASRWSELDPDISYEEWKHGRI